MQHTTFIGIIPARYASTRFPGKPLAMLGGQPVIQRVYNQVRSVIENVIVATDDDRIAHAVEAFGGKCVMTSPNHKSGTDRCMEAYTRNGGNEDVVINIQGDEPFVQPSQLETIMKCFDDESTDIATLVKPFDPRRPYAELANPNSPKVVVDNMRHQYYTHLGMYAYRARVLQAITALPQSSLELAESLEQLRWIENGYRIKVGVSDIETIGIDTPQDLARAEEHLRKACKQK